MPQVVAPIAGAIGSFVGGLFSSAAAGIFAAKATTFLLTYVAPSFVLSVASKALAPKIPSTSLTAGSPIQLGRGSVEPRQVIYGEVRLAGKMLDAYVGGTSNEYLHLIIGQAGHECEAIGTVWFNDEVVPLDGSGNATGTFAGYARVKKFLGASGQTADADFVAESSSTRSSSDKFTNIAGLYIRLKWDQNKWPGGIPNPSALVKGRKLYDPRTATTVWSDNPALCVRDYLTNTDYGLGVDSTEIDDTSFIAAANACDELVSLAAGGTEKRYRCNGVFERSEGLEPGVVLDKLVETMAGTLAYIGGKWECHAGVWQTPTITLDETDLRAPIEVQTDLSLSETCNRVRGRFTSPDENYNVVDFTPINNALYLSEDGGLEIWHDLDLQFVQSQSQAQRIAKIVLEQTRQGITVRMPCKLTALRVKAGSTVLIDNAECGWVAKPFRVQRLRFVHNATEDGVTLDVDLFLRETASACYDWNNGEETTYDPAANTNLLNILSVPVPAGLTLNAAGSSDRTVLPRIRASITAPTDQSVLSGGQTQFAYKKNADSDWITWSTIPGDQTVDFIADLQVGTLYNVRARHRNSYGVWGAWCTAVNLTAPSGEGNYQANLTNDLHGVACDAEGNALSGELGSGGRAFTDVLAWAGSLALTPVASSPTIGQYSISAALLSGTASFTKVDDDTVRCDTLTTSSATIRITFSMEGVVTITRDFTLVKVTSGGAYWLVSDAAAVNKTLAGAYTPATLNFSGFAKLLTGAPAAYAGRFKIATYDGSTWTDTYTSASDEATKAYTVPASIKAVRCRLYQAGGTSTLLDEEIIPVTSDGATGATGATGPAGANGTNGATVLGSAGGGGSVSSSTYANISPDLTLTVSCDGNPKIIRFSAAYIANASGSTQTCHVAICDGTTVIGELGDGNGVELTAGQSIPIELSIANTPSAGSHTFRIQVKGSAGNSVATGGQLSVI